MEELYHIVEGKKVLGPNPILWGDCFNLSGDCSGLWGNCTDLWSDCTGISGECTDLVGNLDLIKDRPTNLKDYIDNI